MVFSVFEEVSDNLNILYIQTKTITIFAFGFYGFIVDLKELHHDILSHFFNHLSQGLSVGKPKTNGLLMKGKTKGVILKQKGTRMAEDRGD